MQKIGLWVLKAFVAGIAAFAVLCVFSLFYDNSPPAITVKNALNDFPGQPNYFYCYMLEGFGYGKTDKNGYINLPEAADNDKYDVLIMGSSHMEAMQIPQSITVASILNKNLENLNVYNIAIAGRSFLYNVQNLKNALEHHRPKYLVLETTDVNLTSDQIKLALSNEITEISPLGTGIKQYLQKIPYLRLIYHQYTKTGGIFSRPGSAKEPAKTSYVPPPNDDSLLTELLDKISHIANENGTKPIIIFHQPLQINKDGSAITQTDANNLKSFDDACHKAGIVFVDMTEIFLEAYRSSYILPHGFFNSQIGAGHLNAHGHEMVANELIRVIL